MGYDKLRQRNMPQCIAFDLERLHPGREDAGSAATAGRAIEWSERGIRLRPFDPWTFAVYDDAAL